MKKTIFLMICFPIVMLGQQESYYSLYFENMQVINPAFAGSKSKNEFTLLNRNQWTGLSDSPKIMTLSYSYKAKKNIGIGFSVVSDKVFIENQTFAYVDVSYRLKINDKTDFYFGLKAGGNFYKSNVTDLTIYNDQFDPLWRNFDSFNPNVGAGLYLKNPRFWFSFSIPRLFLIRRDREINVGSKDRIHTYLAAGYKFNLTEKISVKPNLIYRKIKAIPSTMDLTLNLNYDNAFEVGYSHRTNSSNSNLIIFHLSNEVSVGLCYDRPFLNRLGGIDLKTYEILIRLKTN